jgi:hypothetical protein
MAKQPARVKLRPSRKITEQILLNDRLAKKAVEKLTQRGGAAFPKETFRQNIGGFLPRLTDAAWLS